MKISKLVPKLKFRARSGQSQTAPGKPMKPAKFPKNVHKVNRQAQEAINKGNIGEALTLSARAYQNAGLAWNAGTLFKDCLNLPDWSIVLTLLETANQLWELRRSAAIVRDRNLGISKEVLDQQIKDVEKAFDFLWRRAERIATLAAQNVTELKEETNYKPRKSWLGGVRQEAVKTYKEEFKYKRVEQQLNREEEKLKNLIENIHKTREGLAELTISGGGKDFEIVTNQIGTVVEATRELEGVSFDEQSVSGESGNLEINN